MANNRMYLMHRPSQKAVFLGKRLGEGWYDVPDDIKQRIETLFSEVDSMQGESIAPIQDDFCVALEDASDAAIAVKAPQDVIFPNDKPTPL